MPTTSASSAREILTGLHDVMASRLGAQAKLNRVVKIIAEAMASEVCSIYLLREGVLELFATIGLNQSAVHVTKLALGEGLVGTIARQVAVLNLAEAAGHPEFAYRPETGEELFHSFAGVPIVRRERAIGVLCVQHADPRAYDHLEIEALQTVAMVLSELIANAGLADKAASASAATRDQGSIRLGGLRLVTGMAKGIAVYHQPRILIEHTVAEDVEEERRRVYSAFRRMREQIDSMTSLAEFGTAGEHHDILATYKMFAYDEGWSRRINEAIDSGLTAEAAIERVRQRMQMRMREIDDPLLQDRMHDLDDLSNRLLRIVSGRLGTAAQMGLHADAILIARNLGPAELLEYDRRRLKGVILEEGSLTAHVTIVARAMGVPVLGRVRDVRQGIGEGDEVLLDVGEGAAFVRPTATIEDAFRAKLLVTQKRRAEFAAMRDMPPVTLDGTRITVNVNAGLRDDVEALEMMGADGIGLFRTEFQFLVSASLPRRETQQRLYKSVLDAAGDKPVVFRTVDVGGDKALPYIDTAEGETEDNPAMGWRALRLALDREGLMKAQARALLEAAAGRELRIMFPMVSEPWEFDAARAIVEQMRAWLAGRKKVLPTQIYYGAMLEVPALAETLDLLLPKLDFLSIGTNDLTQYALAAERGNEELVALADPLDPGVLALIGAAGATASDDVLVAVCGELASDEQAVAVLLGLGVRELSVAPAAVARVKDAVRRVDIPAARGRAAASLAAPDAAAVRRLLSE
ncbi:MAG: phosphoenolpyruvate--protein phosphotransferase [Alphaproteobacteria bacterium]|nr:phosphoenolpyruvate--protein phosphotransferase [Alphaproteobacteria bacterium]